MPIVLHNNLINVMLIGINQDHLLGRHMQAVVFYEFGAPNVLKLVEKIIPACESNQVLIKLHAAGLNPIDYKIRNGTSSVSKKIKDHFPSGLGYDLAGTVVAIGNEIENFQIGDAVFGINGMPEYPACYAEYACATAATIIQKPSKISFLQAAALPTAGLTALQALRLASVVTGQRVLVHAGAGGVGHIAVQLAKEMGATVITTASIRNHDFLHALGAAHCIDYREKDFTTLLSQPVDTVIDLIGGEVGIKSLDILSPNGCLVTVPTVTAEQVIASAKAKNRHAIGMLRQSDMSELSYLANKIIDGHLTVDIAKAFKLSEAVFAHEMLEHGHVRGKLVFEI